LHPRKVNEEMAFVTGTCPNCSGEIRLDSTKESGFCLHCGRSVTLEKAVAASKINIQQLAENYQILVNQAFKVENYAEAEVYANKILELNPGNYQAWLDKGRAAGHLSTSQRMRYKEAVGCLLNAYTFATETQKEELKLIINGDFEKTVMATVDFLSRLFENQADRENAERILAWCMDLADSQRSLKEKCGLEGEFTSVVAARLDKAVRQAWKKQVTPFTEIKHPNAEQWRAFYQVATYCLMLTRHTIRIDDDNLSAQITRAKRIINYNNCLLESCFYIPRSRPSYYGSYYDRVNTLTEVQKEEIHAENRKMITFLAQNDTHFSAKKSGFSQAKNLALWVVGIVLFAAVFVVVSIFFSFC